MKYILFLIFILCATAQGQSLPNLIWFAKELKHSVVIARVVSVDVHSPIAIIVTRDGKNVKTEGLFEAKILVVKEIFVPNTFGNNSYTTRVFAPYNKNVLFKTRSVDPNIWENDITRYPVIMVIATHPQLELSVDEACVGSLPLVQLPLVEKEIYNSILQSTEYFGKWGQSYQSRQ